MRLVTAACAAFATWTLSAATAGAYEGVDVLRAAAHELKGTRTLKRGVPWDLETCELRCIELDGLWDDCLVAGNITKCLSHCFRWEALADCFRCNQERLHKDYHIYELQLGEVCVKFLSDPSDLSWAQVIREDGKESHELFTFGGQAPTQSFAGDKPPSKTITAEQAL